MVCLDSVKGWKKVEWAEKCQQCELLQMQQRSWYVEEEEVELTRSKKVVEEAEEEFELTKLNKLNKVKLVEMCLMPKLQKHWLGFSGRGVKVGQRSEAR